VENKKYIIRMTKINITSFLPWLLGFFAFIVIVGIQPLMPGNISWISDGDGATSYLGWLFFRNTEWALPLGLNPRYGLEISNSIVFSDSIPLLAILFKLFSAYLPDVFQYHGIWVLLSFLLHSFFAWKLIGIWSNDNLLKSFGVLILLFSPSMMFRLQIHISLVSHFFVLAALYYALTPEKYNRTLIWSVLLITSLGVHFYISALVLFIFVSDSISKRLMTDNKVRIFFLELFGFASIYLLFAWLYGYFSVIGDVATGGYSLTSMNFLSLINPASGGWFDWSYVLRSYPQGPGQHEGFNYLGLGVIFLIVVLIPVFAEKIHLLKSLCKRYLHLLILFFILTLYSLSNIILFADFVLFEYSLPEQIDKALSILRGSGRLFWPVLYGIVLFSIIMVIKSFRQKVSYVLLSVAVIVQIVDTSAGWLKIQNRLHLSPLSTWGLPFHDHFWTEAAEKYSKIRYIPLANHRHPEWQPISYFAALNGLSTDSPYLARVDMNSYFPAYDKSLNILKNGQFESDSIYLLDDNSFKTALINIDLGKHLATQIDGFNVIAPFWNDR
jgi:hypothetical protein